MNHTLFRASLSVLGVSLALVGCSNSTIDGTKEWMQQQQRAARPSVRPLPEPKPYAALDYKAPQQGADPFSFDRLANALGINAAAANNPLLLKEQNRRKQPLESYPLDTISYVGMLQKNGQPIALVKVDTLLYQAHVGDYMGQNYGRITEIKENQVTLHEIAQDAAGEWIERTTTLDLQEGTKEGTKK
ncbi:MAG: pilus assembly protein PilP [Brachymonas sp.]|uniref:pilus assembly protein PilP n=1 Tax=Brachymonas sp. TaxID=1936292 RepID=UPI0035ADD830